MLINKVSDYLASFAIGIRFRANFSIEDQLGRIVDDILYTNKSYFGPEFFPLVEGRINYKRLFSHEGDKSLVINNSNIVIEIFFSKNDQNDNLISDVREHFNNDIILGVMKTYGVTQINRIGYINRYIFNDKNVSKAFLDKTMGHKLDGVNDTNLRFSKKYPLSESLVKKDVNDYDNAIFNLVKQSDKHELEVSIDYQRFYSPMLELSAQIETKEFYKSVDTFNNETFKKWFNESYGESNAKTK